MDQDLKDKVAIVTGAAHGIGRAITLALADRGATILATDIDDDSGAETIALVEAAGGTGSYAHCDVTKAEDVEKTMLHARESLGPLSILVNNAGTEGQIKPLYDFDDDEFERVHAINTRSVYLGIKYASQIMRKDGQGGSIINIASVAGLLGLDNGIAYSASKHAVIGMTKTAALDLAADNIRVNAVCPGIIRTRMANTTVEALGGVSMADVADTLHPLQRIGEPTEVAELVVWLASDRSSFCTGAEYKVDGGYAAR